MTLQQAREKVHNFRRDMRMLIDQADKEGRTLTPDEQAKFDKMEADKEQAQKALDERLKEIDYRQKEFAGERARADNLEAPNLFGRVAQKLFTGEAQERGITSTSGAATIQDPVLQMEIINTLKDSNPLSRLGARFKSLPNHAKWPKVTAPPSVTWFSEGDTISADSAMTIGSVDITLRTAPILVKASKLWLQDSGDMGRALIGTEIVNAIQEQVINVALHGSTASKQPNGLDNRTGDGVQTESLSSVAISDYDAFVDCVGNIAANNADLSKVGYIYGTSTLKQLAKLKATTNDPLQPPKIIADMPGYHTNAVLENYGAGTNETRVYFGDFSQMVIGMGGTFRMELAEKYADTLETGFLIWMRMDLTLLHPNLFCILTDVATS